MSVGPQLFVLLGIDFRQVGHFFLQVMDGFFQFLVGARSFAITRALVDGKLPPELLVLLVELLHASLQVLLLQPHSPELLEQRALSVEEL